MSRTARSVNLTLTYLIITTMILSGIQVMLPALGHEWYSQNEQNLEDATPNSEYTAPADIDLMFLEYLGYSSAGQTRMVIDSNDIPHILFNNNIGNELTYATIEEESWIFETLDSSLDGLDIALDSNNNVHVITSTTSSPNEVKYYSRTSAAPGNPIEWNSETIFTSPPGTNMINQLGIEVYNDIPYVAFAGYGEQEGIKYGS